MTPPFGDGRGGLEICHGGFSPSTFINGIASLCDRCPLCAIHLWSAPWGPLSEIFEGGLLFYPTDWLQEK